ncbi:nitroreductase/quinone reductase family protein [Kribbella kalugense]
MAGRGVEVAFIKTGQRRTTPVVFHPESDSLFVITSSLGAPQHPDW